MGNAEFQEYKANFLKANPVRRGFVLVRRERDNQLSICRREHVEHYEGHVIEPFNPNDSTSAATPQKTKPGRKAKETEIEPEEV